MIMLIERIFPGDEVDLGFSAIGSGFKFFLLGWAAVLALLDVEKDWFEPDSDTANLLRSLDKTMVQSSSIHSAVSLPVKSDGGLLFLGFGDS